MFGHGRLRRHRLPLDPARRPGHRALRRRQLRQESRLLRRAKTSSSSPSKAAATPSPPPSASSAPSRASTPTRFPFLVKINHNELLTFPNQFDQILFGTVKEAYDMGAAAVGATIYFGSDRRRPPDRRGQPGLRARPRAGHGHRSLVLPPQQRLQEGQGLPLRRPT